MALDYEEINLGYAEIMLVKRLTAILRKLISYINDIIICLIATGGVNLLRQEL